MANTSKGKKLEGIFEHCWASQFGRETILRLHDQMSGYKVVSRNPSDFICYSYPKMMYVECKETTGNTLNWKAFSQYDNLVPYAKIDGILAGVLIWFSEQQVVAFVSIKDCIKMHEEGKKSIAYKDITDPAYNILQVKSEIKRIYPVLDLTEMAALPDTW